MAFSGEPSTEGDSAVSTSTGQRVQSSVNLVLPMVGVKESSAVIHFKKGKITEEREAIGTLHFARFVELNLDGQGDQSLNGREDR
jgi:hypothetical protein